MRPFTMRASARAAESQYARIVELVKTAQATKAPFQRLADRYAVWFTPCTLVVAIGAALLSGEWTRMLAVLVVATPCPLILAPPIAVIGGMNRAARRQVIIRNGAAIERLAHVNAAVFDKTGTLTIGKPAVSDVTPIPPNTRSTLVHAAASLEQASGHLLARTLVEAAVAEHIPLAPATDVIEAAGHGVTGVVDGTHVTIGSRRYIERFLSLEGRERLATLPAVGLMAYVALDGELAGTVTYADHLRPGVRATLAALRTLGIERMALLTGDHGANAHEIAEAVGISDVRSELSPDEKVAAVRALAADPRTTLMMIGDGTNDAPALSTAAVGVALAGHGGGAVAEAADVVILADDLWRVPEVLRISDRTMRIARESMWAGMVLSGIAMGVAAAGMIAPAMGAVLQEIIDVAVILNALRASTSTRKTDSVLASAPMSCRDPSRTCQDSHPDALHHESFGDFRREDVHADDANNKTEERGGQWRKAEEARERQKWEDHCSCPDENAQSPERRPRPAAEKCPAGPND
jgi:heavy metal translocating P-type ATPase